MPANPPVPPGSPAESDATAALPPLPPLAIVWLALAAFASGASMRVNDALLPPLAREFGISLGEAAQVTSYFAIAYGVAQLFFGPLGDRFGKYRVVAWASAGCAVTAALCGFAPDFGWLRLLRALAGVTAAALIPLSMAWIGDVVSYGQRQTVLARFMIGMILGLAAGVWVGGLAADHLHWRAPYFLLAALFAAAAAGLHAFHRRLPAHAKTVRRAGGSPLGRLVADFRHVLAQRWARSILACVFLEGLLLYGPFAFIAVHLHHALGIPLSGAGSLLMLFGLGGLAFALGSRHFVSRLGEVGLARWGGAAMAASFLLVGYAPSWLLAVPACLGAGLGFYMLHNTLQVNATQMAPERRGAAVSAFASAFFLGQSAGVSAAGWLAERIGTAHVIGLAGPALLLVALGFARLRSRTPQPSSPTA